MTVAIEDLPDNWRALAAMVRDRGAEPQAATLELGASALEGVLGTAGNRNSLDHTTLDAARAQGGPRARNRRDKERRVQTK